MTLTRYRIPKSFYLGAIKITVEDSDNLADETGCLGQADYKHQKIRLQRSTNSFHLTEQDREQVYFHELTHHILHAMNKSDLRSDEEFVDVFSRFLQQAIVTSSHV